MKKTITLWIFIFFVRTVIAQDATIIYKNTVNSTVTIETDIMIGSGFFVSKNVIATNYHVIEGASEAYCYTNNSSTKYKIEGYLAVDKSVDLILLKVSGLDRVAIKLATNPVSPGQKIFVIGSPKGLPASISDGMVSGLRDFEGIKLIQISAPISPGSSGGPVLNENGELIGISVGQYKDGQNLNFAIPKSSLEVLLSHKSPSPLSITKLYSKFGSFTNNVDGETYKTVKIGTQVWMAENLRTTKFNNGTSIQLVTNAPIWKNLATPAYCWYENNAETYKASFGALYNWYAVNTGRLCPTGWHVPSNGEWAILIDYLGGEDVAGGKMKEVGLDHWDNPNTDATNESGFTALPGGYRDADGTFYAIGFNSMWWSSTEYETYYAGFRLMYASHGDVASGDWDQKVGYSVRCVKD